MSVAFLCLDAKATSFTPTHKKSAKSSVNSDLLVRVPESLTQYETVSISRFERIANNFWKSFLRKQNCVGFKKQDKPNKKIPDTAASF